MREPLDLNTVMAATVHDVKNSLSLIDIQISDVVQDVSELSPKSARKLNRIRLEAGRINNDLVHMLGLYRIKNDTFRPAFEEVMVEDVVKDTIARYSETLTALGVTLDVEFEDAELLWFMDPVLIEGVLANILTNSIRYTCDCLTFSVLQSGGGLSIQITDNGQGYPEKMMNFLNAAENQGDLSFQTGSTGLGLFFCNQIARMHTYDNQEGYIRLSNHPGHGGAMFELWLP